MSEIATILVPLLGGGAAGAVLNEWFRRRRGRVQAIPLIERVNRLVSPELQGFTLARVIASPTGRGLEEVKSLREYQLTIRNTSSRHLKDAEVQFEFPAEDIQAWASRPTLSKTALIPMNAAAAEPWRQAFRWKIPHLPSGDSVEFTFQAVEPSSEKYEAALYQCDGVVFERVVGEPPPKKGIWSSWANVISVMLLMSLFGIIGWLLFSGRLSIGEEKLTAIKATGCSLQVVSFADRYGQNLDSPWRIKHRIFNVGTQTCVVQSEKLSVPSPFIIKPGEILERETVVERRPKLLNVEILVGSTGSALTATTAPVYIEP